VGHDVGGRTPQPAPVVGFEARRDGRVAAVVDGGHAAVALALALALAGRQDAERGVAAGEHRQQGVGAVGDLDRGKRGRRRGSVGGGDARSDVSRPRELAHAAHERGELETLEELLDLATGRA